MISSIMNPPSTSGAYQDYLDSYAVVSSNSRDLSELQKKKIIEDLGCTFQTQIEITDNDNGISINEEGFKKHVKSELTRKIAEGIQQKATFTQLKLAGPMPVIRVKAKVIVMSEQELMNLIDLIRNY